jgi:hypothetical protein
MYLLRSFFLQNINVWNFAKTIISDKIKKAFQISLKLFPIVPPRRRLEPHNVRRGGYKDPPYYSLKFDYFLNIFSYQL